MSPTGEQFAGLFARLRTEWDLSEATIKAAEQVNGEVIVPSIMELRYAGRRAVDALNEAAVSGDMAKAEDYLQDAIFNCHCARHDAIDVATAVIAQRIAAVAQHIGYENVLAAYPGFADLHMRVSRVKSKIRLSRGERGNRDAIYEAIQGEDLPALATAYEEFQASEPLMRKLASRARRRQVASFIITGIVVLAALLSLARDYFDWSWPATPSEAIARPAVR